MLISNFVFSEAAVLTQYTLWINGWVLSQEVLFSKIIVFFYHMSDMGSDIALCIKIDKPRVVYIFSNVM